MEVLNLKQYCLHLKKEAKSLFVHLSISTMSVFLKLSANELSEIERDRSQIFKKKAQQINDASGL